MDGSRRQCNLLEYLCTPPHSPSLSPPAAVLSVDVSAIAARWNIHVPSSPRTHTCFWAIVYPLIPRCPPPHVAEQSVDASVGHQIGAATSLALTALMGMRLAKTRKVKGGEV